VNVGYPSGSSVVENTKFRGSIELQAEKARERNSFKLGSQMDRSTEEVNVIVHGGKDPR